MSILFHSYVGFVSRDKITTIEKWKRKYSCNIVKFVESQKKEVKKVPKILVYLRYELSSRLLITIFYHTELTYILIYL